MPKCSKCSAQPEMICIKVDRILDLDKPRSGGLSHFYGKQHPIMSGVVFAFKSLSWLNSKVYYDLYECPNCKATRRKIDASYFLK